MGGRGKELHELGTAGTKSGDPVYKKEKFVCVGVCVGGGVTDCESHHRSELERNEGGEFLHWPVFSGMGSLEMPLQVSALPAKSEGTCEC